MSWNYRVIRKKVTGGGFTYQVHEVYYNDKGEPEMVTDDGMDPFGESLEELQDDISRMQEAFRKPVLDYEFFEPSSKKTGLLG